MILAIGLALFGSIGLGVETSEHVDLIELNHFYDCRGCHVYDQIIFWRQDPATKRFEVASWTMADNSSKYPQKSDSGRWHVIYQDGQHYRNVRSRQFRESWTQVDPERADQRRVHLDDRIGLIQGCIAK
jgi:hypothetical protein